MSKPTTALSTAVKAFKGMTVRRLAICDLDALHTTLTKLFPRRLGYCPPTLEELQTVEASPLQANYEHVLQYAIALARKRSELAPVNPFRWVRVASIKNRETFAGMLSRVTSGEAVLNEVYFRAGGHVFTVPVLKGTKFKLDVVEIMAHLYDEHQASNALPSKVQR